MRKLNRFENTSIELRLQGLRLFCFLKRNQFLVKTQITLRIFCKNLEAAALLVLDFQWLKKFYLEFYIYIYRYDVGYKVTFSISKKFYDTRQNMKMLFGQKSCYGESKKKGRNSKEKVEAA